MCGKRLCRKTDGKISVPIMIYDHVDLVNSEGNSPKKKKTSMCCACVRVCVRIIHIINLFYISLFIMFYPVVYVSNKGQGQGHPQTQTTE